MPAVAQAEEVKEEWWNKVSPISHCPHESFFTDSLALRLTPVLLSSPTPAYPQGTTPNMVQVNGVAEFVAALASAGEKLVVADSECIPSDQIGAYRSPLCFA